MWQLCIFALELGFLYHTQFINGIEQQLLRFLNNQESKGGQGKLESCADLLWDLGGLREGASLDGFEDT